MSLLARIAARGGFAPAAIAPPVMTPKDCGVRRATAIQRQPEDEEEPMQALRRQPIGNEEEPMQALHRQPTDEEDEPVQAKRIHRQEAAPEEEEAAPEEEEPAQLMRRQPAEEEEPMRTLRRQPAEEVAEPVRTRQIHRELQPDEPELNPRSSPPPEITPDEPGPPSLRAAYAEAPAAAGQAPTIPPYPTSNTPPLAPPRFDVPDAPPSAPTATPDSEFRRPHIVIDQLDVLIHEPAPPARPTSASSDRSRALRARYLRRL